MARLYYIHWDKDEALTTVRRLRKCGHVVRYEAKDGKKTWKQLKDSPPDVLVVSLERLPSHGRRVAAVTRESKKLRDLPVVFVGGEKDKVSVARKEFPRAEFCSTGRLERVLERY